MSQENLDLFAALPPPGQGRQGVDPYAVRALVRGVTVSDYSSAAATSSASSAGVSFGDSGHGSCGGPLPNVVLASRHTVCSCSSVRT